MSNSTDPGIIPELLKAGIIPTLCGDMKGSMKVDTSGSEDLYFVAPDKYLGDQRFAYTFALSFHLQQGNASSPAASSKGDVILEGKWFGHPLVSTLGTPPPGGNNFDKYEYVDCKPSLDRIVVIWKFPSSLSTSLMAAIDGFETLMATAFWTLSVLVGAENATNVETCSCPPEYKGQFCEQCASGFTRVAPNRGPYVTCQFKWKL
ncbi:hypothetical protein OS493_029648 [Desmophyllum pertusum]|uniref:Laminin IV type A domain-containing protein n=1 Tax=Desmophyllum pertusum TaxID=174260 RepID=A0A9W9ZKZ5_9CNID|nr:hypothetical protein OS493_029648 [Desmophyllum pertusum]